MYQRRSNRAREQGRAWRLKRRLSLSEREFVATPVICQNQVLATMPKEERQGTADLQWKQITSERELLRWEEAWSQTASSLGRLFLPALLHDADICIIAAYKENQIVAGAIANRTTEVVGLSNVFAPRQETERYWEGLLSLIATHYPSLPIVGYEQDESLTTALHVGFTALGPLRVWIKEG
jgi:hypothetical protein